MNIKKDISLSESLNFNEFKNDAKDILERNAKSFSDEMIFRKAKIYKCLGVGDDRLQVQIFPEFSNIDKDELDNLPKYPMFFSGTLVTGASQVEDGDKAEYVWVLCTPDFQVGYVLGKAEVFGDSSKPHKTTKSSANGNSYGYKNVKSFIAARRAIPEDFEYNHISVVRWFETDKGGHLECYNYMTGDWMILNTSGTILTLQQKRMYLRVGSPDPAAGPTAFSAITITPERIHIKSPNFEVDAQDTVLGHHNMMLSGTPASGPLIAKNGPFAMGLNNIHV